MRMSLTTTAYMVVVRLVIRPRTAPLMRATRKDVTMKSYRGISRNEYWMMRGEPTYVIPSPVNNQDHWTVAAYAGMDSEPWECSKGHDRCSRH